MSSLELVARGWTLLLALTFALLIVMLLRHTCRRWLGVERAFQLWLLAPLAMLASQLPHSAHAVVTRLPPLVLSVTSTATTIAQSTQTLSGGRWQTVILLLWLVGMLAGAILAVVAQRRYQRRLRDAVRLEGVDVGWPIWRAADGEIGPALVGVWRPRIVVPIDFEQRYDVVERALILAHEATHAERRDGWWSLCAQVLLVTCWFHPLVWWAQGAFRLDQELACDASVLRARQAERYRYAQAMLKTQSAPLALPLGCSWSPRHPITERVAMLKLLPPGRTRRVIGRSTLLVLGVVIAGGVYAATNQGGTRTDRYGLKIELGVNGQPARLHATMCLKQGQYYEAIETVDPLPPWRARFTVVPAAEGQLEVQAEISGGSIDKPASPRIRMLPGQTGTIETGRKAMGADGKIAEDRTLRVDLTPSIGC